MVFKNIFKILWAIFPKWLGNISKLLSLDVNTFMRPIIFYEGIITPPSENLAIRSVCLYFSVFAKNKVDFLLETEKENKLKEIEKKLTVDNNIIRYLTVKYDNLDLKQEYFSQTK